jgi:hypothetical protein
MLVRLAFLPPDHSIKGTFLLSLLGDIIMEFQHRIKRTGLYPGALNVTDPF